jgi:hypothetical protein
MAAQQPADYTIFCVVVDNSSPFPVDISPHKTVGHLKKAIKLEKQPDFDKFAADNLDLYLINLAYDGSLIEKTEELLASHSPLNPTDKLSAVFQGPPEDGIVHILVKPPQTSEFLCAGIRRMTRLTNHPRHSPGTKRKPQNEDSELESEDPKPPTKRRRNGPRLSDEPTRLSGW